ncbi:MAG: DUF4145 domain-containing protein [Ignavibacteriales bacterium]|nr:DUF4145 domain-containing protein [Ignavibacteriales bacterium]
MEIAKIILEYVKVLIWPITTFTILILFRKQIKDIIARLKKAEFPGGISFETIPEKIDEAKALSNEVKQEKSEKENKEKRPVIPLTEANAKMLNLGLLPSPSGLELSYYREIAQGDPVLALAGLRIELETMLKNLAKGYNLLLNKRDSLGIIVKKLRDRVAITSKQAELINAIIKLSNAAIHGTKITTHQAKDILEISKVLRDDYIRWLSWGFPESKE